MPTPELSVAEIGSADAVAPMRDEDFDDALWLAALPVVGSGDLASFPPGFRAWFSTRYVESEIGSGGVSEGMYCAGEYWDDAIAGYRHFGDAASAALLERIKATFDNGAEYDDLDEFLEEIDGPPWNGVPWGDEARTTYVRTHRFEFTAITGPPGDLP